MISKGNNELIKLCIKLNKINIFAIIKLYCYIKLMYTYTYKDT